MSTLLVLALFLPLLLLLGDGKWRESLLYCVVIGFVQDPLRKITPDRPPLYTGLVLIGLSITALVLFTRAGRINLSKLFDGDRSLTTAIEMLLGLVAIQAFNSFTNYNSESRVVLGIGFYFAPILALWMGYQFGLQPDSVRRFLWVYSIIALLFTLTFILDLRGAEGPIFEEVVSKLTIVRSGMAEGISGYTGFWRTTEIAGWHLATCASFIFILSVQKRKPWAIAVGSILMVALMVFTTLTGRRKALILVLAFLGFFGLLAIGRLDKKVLSSLSGGIFSGTLVISVLGLTLGNFLQNKLLSAYLENTTTIWGELYDRLVDFVTNSIINAYLVGGIFGAGVGAAAQGVGNFGQSQVVNIGAAEAGIGKIVVELGLIGLALLIFIFIRLVGLYWRIISQQRYTTPAFSIINLGLTAFLAANIFNFTVASQTYGDPFVLSLLGLCCGFILASQAVIKSQMRAQRLAAESLMASPPTLATPAAPPGVSNP